MEESGLEIRPRNDFFLFFFLDLFFALFCFRSVFSVLLSVLSSHFHSFRFVCFFFHDAHAATALNVTK